MKLQTKATTNDEAAAACELDTGHFFFFDYGVKVVVENAAVTGLEVATVGWVREQ